MTDKRKGLIWTGPGADGSRADWREIEMDAEQMDARMKSMRDRGFRFFKAGDGPIVAVSPYDQQFVDGQALAERLAAAGG